MQTTLTQEELKKLLHYDPDTGVFVWVKSFGNKVKISDVAGCLKITKGCKRYIYIQFFGKRYLSHRLAFLYMTGSFPEYDIDHINGDGTDNRWANLRAVTRLENKKNVRRQSNNKSGICGVCFNKINGKWQAQIQVDRKNKFIGIFDNIFDAACARKNAECFYGFHANHGSERPL